MKVKTRGVIIQGSSRSIGNSSVVASFLRQQTDFSILDLKKKDIGYFDYQHLNTEDDFIPLMKQLVADVDTFIFLSPVYWYSMSAEMKTFFDRISDLLKIEKDTGRKLRGKTMAAISCSEGDDVPMSFYEPFRLSADYLGMQYAGHAHAQIRLGKLVDVSAEALAAFSSRLLSSPPVT